MVSAPQVLLDAGTLPVPISMDCQDEEASIPDDGMVYPLPVFSGESGSARGRPKQAGENDMAVEDDKNMEYFHKLVNRGLILQRCGDRKGHFCRIGSFHLPHDPFPDENLEAEENRYYHELMGVLDKVGAVTAEAEAAKVVPNSDFPEARYVITIE